MDYESYIEYHSKGDAGVEERMISSICERLSLDSWNSFRLIYYYTMTYNIPSSLDMLYGERNIKNLNFRTDRRYVRCNGAYKRLLSELTKNKLITLSACKTTEEAYKIVSQWYFFGRYAAFLFLEVYYNVFKPKWNDNIRIKWNEQENFTKGAILIARTKENSKLDEFIERAKKDTGDNSFALETSLCAVAKFVKGTRWDGFYTERMIKEIKGTRYESFIMSML